MNGPPAPDAVDPPPGDDPQGPAGPVPGVWPFGSWAEVEAHRARGDGRFLTPDDTALRLARTVAGSSSSTVTAVDIEGRRATVTLRHRGASTVVRLVRAVGEGPRAGAPWSVTGATGGVDLTADDRVAGARLTARTTSAATVALFDRDRWRGVGVVTAAGTLDVRIEPGPAARAMVLALDGDPRDPASFSLRPVDLRSGAGEAAPAPTGVQTATDALLAALRTGDVGAVWAVLSTGARSEAIEWRGIAVRLPNLRERWAALDATDRLTVTVPTSAGEVAVVLPGSGSSPGLTLAVGGGTAKVASVEGATTELVPEPGAVVLRGVARPVALLVDGEVVTGEPVGEAGVRISLATVPPGPHVVSAVVVEDGRPRVDRHAVVLGGFEPPSTVPPPEGDAPPAGGA